MGITNNTKARSIINEISKRNPSKFKVTESVIPGIGSPAKHKGTHPGKDGHTHAKAINKKDIPLSEQDATASDSLAIKMDQIYKSPKFAHIGKGNWSDIATEAKKLYPNIDPTTYERKDIKGTINAKKAREKYGL